jgi:DNA transformation protein and related proteins
MAAQHDETTAHCLELLAPLGAVRTTRMFGGRGFYVDDLFCALILNGRLYLKTDAVSRPRFEAAGCQPFEYDAKGRRVTISYFSAPDDAMESPALMQPWARLALEAALRARAARPASARASPPARPAAKKATARKPAATKR